MAHTTAVSDTRRPSSVHGSASVDRTGSGRSEAAASSTPQANSAAHTPASASAAGRPKRAAGSYPEVSVPASRATGFRPARSGLGVLSLKREPSSPNRASTQRVRGRRRLPLAPNPTVLVDSRGIVYLPATQDGAVEVLMVDSDRFLWFWTCHCCTRARTHTPTQRSSILELGLARSCFGLVTRGEAVDRLSGSSPDRIRPALGLESRGGFPASRSATYRNAVPRG